MTTPSESSTTGLRSARCTGCAAQCAADASYTGPVRCTGCWTDVHQVGQFIPQRRARFCAGDSPGISAVLATTVEIPATLHRPDDTPTAPTAPGAPTTLRRILVTSRDPIPAGVTAPASAVRIADEAKAIGLVARLTYALSEDAIKGALVESWCVRVRGLGFASYINGRADRAVVVRPTLRACTVTEFAALAAGRQYERPVGAPSGPCPRCGKVVRWRVAEASATPFRHRRVDGEACEVAK